MTTVLMLLAVQGALGGLDTLYYHEWRARLPAGGSATRAELLLHAARDFTYGAIFGSLPWVAWEGGFAAVLGSLLLAEIVLTLADFIVEDSARALLGGVYPGERAMHAVMGIVYGAMLGYLVPVLIGWWSAPTGLAPHASVPPRALRLLLTAFAIGVFLSGVRDVAAATGLPGSNWPWTSRPT